MVDIAHRVGIKAPQARCIKHWPPRRRRRRWAEDAHGDYNVGGTAKVRFTNNGQEIGAMEMQLEQLILASWCSGSSGRPRRMDRHACTLRTETGRRLLHRTVHPRRLEGTRRVHLPLQHQVGGVPDEPQSPAGNRQGPAQPARRQDRQLELKTPRVNADKVFKALADPTRRTLLDLLCADNGQTLGQLCEHRTWPGNRSPSTWACWKTPT